MLTKDLLKYRLRGDRLEPTLLGATPGNIALADRLIAHWRAGVGQRRGDREEAAGVILHESKALVAARGLQKLILDECRFADPASCERLRIEALAASSRLLARPAISSDAHRAAVAEALGIDAESLAERLYGDLPQAAVLEAAPEWKAEHLLDRYNLALCQGLLLHCRELDIEVVADVGMRRRLLKTMRFRRLLADRVTDDGRRLRLRLSGPGSVLAQSNRYGLQLALFLPALACAPNWRARAMITPPRGGAAATLELSDALGLRGESAFLAYVPDELRAVESTIMERFPTWRLVEPQLIPLPDGELAMPDLQIEVAGKTLMVELFHRWHAHALARRLQQIGAGAAPRLAIGVDRAVAKDPAVAIALAGPIFARHGFLFSQMPTARALGEVVGRLAGNE